MKTFYKTLVLLFLTAIAITNLHAQNGEIIIRLKQPPPNLMGVGNMWDLTLDNTSGKDMKIYLIGTASEDKDGLIIEGKSKVFTIKPGKTSYKYNDFSGAEIKYNNGKYKEIILRTGNAPEGRYTICVTAFNESGEVVGSENCITQPVQQTGSISLISPSDGEEIDPKKPVLFAWTPIPNGGPYSLKIVELKGEQSTESAMKENRSFFEKERIGTTTFQYSVSEKKFEEGKIYGWQISSGDTKSEVWTYKMTSTNSYVVRLTKLVCTSTPGKYDFTITITVPATHGYNPVKVMSSSNITVISSTPTVGITFTYPALTFPVTILRPGTGTISGSMQTAGSVSLTQIHLLVAQKHFFSATGSVDKSDDLDTTITNACICCGGTRNGVTDIGITEVDKRGRYNMTAFLTAGPAPRMISKVTAEIVYFSLSKANDTNCTMCVADSLMGVFKTSPLPTLTGFTGAASFSQKYPRRIIWENATPVNMQTGRNVNFQLSFPYSFNVTCCRDTVKFAIRFTFTDDKCQSCDTLIYRRIVRTNGPPVILSMNDSEIKTLDNLKYFTSIDNNLFRYPDFIYYDNRQGYSIITN